MYVCAHVCMYIYGARAPSESNARLAVIYAWRWWSINGDIRRAEANRQPIRVGYALLINDFNFNRYRFAIHTAGIATTTVLINLPTVQLDAVCSVYFPC